MKPKNTTDKRGYGAAHQRLRKAWKGRVEAGSVACARCGRWIHPDEPWDLGHDDQDRRHYQGPEHRKCNRGAPNKKKVTRSSRSW